MTYIKINKILYPAKITGKVHDVDWNNRESKTIELNMSYEEAINIFKNNIEWFIVDKESEEEFYEFDNSDFSIAGPITDMRNGKIQAKMGKLTNEEYLEQELARTDEALIELYESIGG